jgi:hypothetical protein
VPVNFNDVFESDGVMEIWIEWEIVTMGKNKRIAKQNTKTMFKFTSIDNNLYTSADGL